MYNYDWWFRGPYQEHLAEAKRRCTAIRKPDLKPDGKAPSRLHGPVGGPHGALPAGRVLLRDQGTGHPPRRPPPSPSSACRPTRPTG